MSFIHYPSINSFRKLIQTKKNQVRHLNSTSIDNDAENLAMVQTENILQYRGTIKLHGMHCDIIKFKDGEYQFQSRNRILSLEDDNKAFVHTMKNAQFENLFDHFALESFKSNVLIAGEFCGSSIQKGVALEQLKEKIFVIYGICVDGVWQDMVEYKHLSSPKSRIYNILDFETFVRTIDFSQNEEELDKVEKELDELTARIDSECPFVKQLTGLSGAGEGIVWTCINYPNLPDLHFKTKGPSHSVVIKKPVMKKNSGPAERVSSFVESVVPEARLHQGVEYCREMKHDLGDKSTAQIFTSWIIKDVFKEEGDQFESLGLSQKDVENGVKKVTFKWFAGYTSRL